ncbi:uncharacterized protein LOC119280843 [Triticum dicoccoides]|uniref:uncharacterized protein LOC119280843 n=1 Tax=Triticum dicoccoides TaxID=85692 RepID=UPI00188F7226|nr:uncharacterized protein LOC119280843 [Triticum dicoccoides]
MVPVIDMDSLPVPQAEGTTTRVPRSKSQVRPDRGGRRRHDRLLACSPTHGTSCVRGALSLPAGFDGMGRGAALPQIRNRVVRPVCRLPSTSTALCSSVFSPSAGCGGATPLSAGSSYKRDGQTEPCGKQLHQLSDVQRFSSLRFFARLISKHEATARWPGLGTMLIARVQGSREAAGSVVLCMLMVSWMRVTNSTYQLRKLLS